MAKAVVRTVHMWRNVGFYCLILLVECTKGVYFELTPWTYLEGN